MPAPSQTYAASGSTSSTPAHDIASLLLITFVTRHRRDSEGGARCAYSGCQAMSAEAARPALPRCVPPAKRPPVAVFRHARLPNRCCCRWRRPMSMPAACRRQPPAPAAATAAAVHAAVRCLTPCRRCRMLPPPFDVSRQAGCWQIFAVGGVRGRRIAAPQPVKSRQDCMARPTLKTRYCRCHSFTSFQICRALRVFANIF